MTSVASRVRGPLFFLLALTLLSWGAAAQAMDDPRNQSDEYYDALNGAKCYVCHLPDGFTAGRISFLKEYRELPLDTPTNLTVRYTHDSGNSQDIQNLRLVVDTSAAPNVDVVTPNATSDLRDLIEDTIDASSTRVHKIELDQGVADAYLAVSAAATELPLETGQKLDVQLLPADDSDPILFEGSARHRSLQLDSDAISNGGFGTYRIQIRWEDPTGAEPQTDLQVHLFVNQTQVETEFAFEAPSDTKLRQGQFLTFDVPIIVRERGPALLDFRVESVSFYTHGSGDAAPRDDGSFVRFAKMQFAGGDNMVLAQAVNGAAPVGVSVDLYSLFTRVVGFTTLLLVPVALLTGGVFGKSSRRWMNTLTGGAKKRVLWHSAMSWMIIVLASGHFLLALLEQRFAWTQGLLWGGVGWALLVSLGFTGYYQVRMIKRWNYRTWRHVHLWSAVGVLGFGSSHMLLDGSSLDAVRALLGPWADRVGWP